MFRNMATSLVTHERIETTLHKAKELRSIADNLITLGKRNDLHARKQAFQFIRSDSVVAKLFSDLAPRFKDRNGGYTRVLHLGERVGDAAPMALIEYLPGEGAAVTPETAPKKREKKATAKKPPKGLAPKEEKKEPKKTPKGLAPAKAEKKAEKARKKEEKAKKKEEKKSARQPGSGKKELKKKSK